MQRPGMRAAGGVTGVVSANPQLQCGQIVQPVVGYGDGRQGPVMAGPAVAAQPVMVNTNFDAMQVNGACPDFARGICKVVNNCPFEHPEHLRKAAQCRGLIQFGKCKWGRGCSYTHAITQPHTTQPIAPQQTTAQPANPYVPQMAAQANTAANSPDDATYYLANERGDWVNAQNEDSYCKNWARGVCKNKKCRRVHAHPYADLIEQLEQHLPEQTPYLSHINYFQGGGGEEVPPIEQEATTTKKKEKKKRMCRNFAATVSCPFGDRCRFSHDLEDFADAQNGYSQPATLQQHDGDTQMGDAALNGDNHNHNPINNYTYTHPAPMAPQTPKPTPNFNKPCNNERNGRVCQRLNCSFIHSDPQSRNYAARNAGMAFVTQRRDSGVQLYQHPQPQSQSQPRGPGDITFANQPIQFASVDYTAQGQGQSGHPVEQWVSQVAVQTQAQTQAQRDMPPPPGRGRGRGNAQQQQHQQQRNQNAPAKSGHGGQECYNCGQQGHIKRDCPFPSQSQSQSQSKSQSPT